MDRSLDLFKDALAPRRQECSNFLWVSRELKPTVAYRQAVKPTPAWHKQQVIKSRKMQGVVQKLCETSGKSREEVEHQIWSLLDEIGFNKRLQIIRWLGLVLTKIFLKVCTGIYVNESSVKRLKCIMGNAPVIFLPSHRSYGDFILMSYLCFTYNIEIPAIAAGMDFHSMWGMGTMLRDTGAFFIRRSYNDDNLYWDTFRQYINQIVTCGDLAIEFFIEGTRSRSGKSLSPKFGLLSMILKAFFTSEVPDIIFVPINISYDRVLEEKLFTYELIGVPKPKESTSGFFKSLSIMKEKYGKIYVEFAKPISARSFFESRIDKSIHEIKPVHMQKLSSQEKNITAALAYDIVRVQQKHSVITTFNLIAVSLTNKFISEKSLYTFDNLISDVQWLKDVLQMCGVLTDLQEISQDVEASFTVHRNLVEINGDGAVELVKNAVAIKSLDTAKLKGHVLSQETITFVVPFILLQFYVNPVMHYLSDPAMLVVALKFHGTLAPDELFEHYRFLRSLFSYEFVSTRGWDYVDFQASLRQLIKLKVLKFEGGGFYLSGDSKRLRDMLHNVLKPFLFTYYVICKILSESETYAWKEKEVIVRTQAILECIINRSKQFIHPYCLNLDSISNCLSSLTSLLVLKRLKKCGDVKLEVNNELSILTKKIDVYVASELFYEELKHALPNICLDAKL